MLVATTTWMLRVAVPIRSGKASKAIVQQWHKHQLQDWCYQRKLNQEPKGVIVICSAKHVNTVAMVVIIAVVRTACLDNFEKAKIFTIGFSPYALGTKHS